MDKSLFKNGIRFKCEGSANCCVSRGSHGYVFLNKNDLFRLAKNFKLLINSFKNKYCQTSEGFIHLKEIRKKGECIFLENKKCGVYMARPTQCRTWPFWPENMNSKIWNKEVVKFCPGIGKGNLISKEKIKKIIELDKRNTREIYRE